MAISGKFSRLRYRPILFVVISSFFLISVESGSTCEAWNEGQNELNSVEYTCARPVDKMKPGLYKGTRAVKDDIIPPWFDPKLWTIGQKYAKRNFFSIYLGPIVSLSMFTNFPTSTPVLIGTGKSHNPAKSNRRYLATMLQMKLIYEQPNVDGQINPNILEMLHTVRGIHYNVASNYDRNNRTMTPDQKLNGEEYKIDEEMWDAMQKDLEASSIPQKYRQWPEYLQSVDPDSPAISQLACSLTQWLLGGLPVLYPERIGIHGATDEELIAFTHLWAVVGYAMGMEDSYNIAIQPSLNATKKYYLDFFNTYYLPSLFQQTKGSKILHESFYRGTIRQLLGSRGDQLMSVEQFFLLTLENVARIPCPNLRARMTFTGTSIRSGLNQAPTLLGMGPLKYGMNGAFNSLYFNTGGRKIFGIDANDPEQIATKAYA